MIFVLTFGVGYSIANNTMLVSRLPGPLGFVFGNSTIAVCLVAILLNLIFPNPAEKKPDAEIAVEETSEAK